MGLFLVKSAARNRARRGFALIAAIGVLAALFLIVVAADSAVNRGLHQSRRASSISKNLALCEAAAQMAVREYLAAQRQDAEPEGAATLTLAGAKIATELQALTETDVLYSKGIFSYRPGDFWVETEIEGKMGAVWLINARNGRKRVVLLEREG
jgi:hypothetical protein